MVLFLGGRQGQVTLNCSRSCLFLTSGSAFFGVQETLTGGDGSGEDGVKNGGVGDTGLDGLGGDGEDGASGGP